MQIDPEQVRDFARAATPPVVGALGGLSGFAYVVLEHQREFRWALLVAFTLFGTIGGGYGVEFIMDRESKGFVFVAWGLGSISYVGYKRVADSAIEWIAGKFGGGDAGRS